MSKSKYFSILVDEVVDVSNSEQISLILQFVDDNYTLMEEFSSMIRGNIGLT